MRVVQSDPRDGRAILVDSLPLCWSRERATINKDEADGELLAQVDAVLGRETLDDSQQRSVGYSQVGMGAQILRDLGVGKIRLMGSPVKYNALEGFGLEVVEFIEP